MLKPLVALYLLPNSLFTLGNALRKGFSKEVSTSSNSWLPSNERQQSQFKVKWFNCSESESTWKFREPQVMQMELTTLRRSGKLNMTRHIASTVMRQQRGSIQSHLAL